MNTTIISGYLEADAQLKTEKTPHLQCVVVTQKAGTGAYAGRIFREKFKVIFYSRDADKMVADYQQGTWVEVIGEASAEAWVGKDLKPRGRIRITARVFAKSVFETEQPATGAEDNPY